MNNCEWSFEAKLAPILLMKRVKIMASLKSPQLGINLWEKCFGKERSLHTQN